MPSLLTDKPSELQGMERILCAKRGADPLSKMRLDKERVLSWCEGEVSFLQMRIRQIKSGELEYVSINNGRRTDRSAESLLELTKKLKDAEALLCELRRDP